ncbi:phosphatidate cytidylyltransferase [Thiomicrorhabdus sediminis]|uniref:Phosphatidate cytidylyltransferase n=1 Tax=Thiomicrorhabdus sediminis TaxID=2580412 RepID=A0A4P9K5V2_9GAMM|nr:phosphatidate cytidylyltransferase [Thiomicrorhabdus sediminis]QCU90191.1 phosphatidate cytidylyltransferase [Thiomicrorhabdus sediminis]
MLKQRVLTAIVLVALSVWGLFFTSQSVWHGLLLAVGFIAAWEWAGFARIDAQALRATYAMIVTLIANFATLQLADDILLFALALQLVFVVAVVTRYQRSHGAAGIQSMLLLLFVGVLLIVPFVVTMTKFRAEFGGLALLSTLALIWLMDSGAYFSGRKFGKDKLAVHVSPGKTWQGVYGGALVSFGGALLVALMFVSNGFVSLLIFALLLTLIAVYSVFGDLFESVLKRQVGLKDSGKILPGHGGVLDRIDSLLVAVPLFYLAWLAFL